MLVLVHEPPSRGRTAHYVVEHEGENVAMCNHWLREGDITTNGEWFVRREQGTDYICMNCAMRKKWLEDRKNEPPVQLPCAEPDKALELFERKDGAALVHVAHDESGGSLCYPAAPGDAWQRRAGTAGEVTCGRCLKSAGLHEGHTPYAKKDRKGKPLPDWWARLERWNEGEARR